MACDHLGPAEVIALAETDLHQRAIPPTQWAQLRYRHGENTPEGMWASVVIEVERRGDGWVVVRLDRNREAIPAEETGLALLTASS